MRLAFNGGAAFKAELRDMSSKLHTEVADAVAETTLAIESGVKLRIQRGSKTGKVYQKYNPRRTHQASAPGQSPATDTGNLINSIYTDIAGLTGAVGSTLAYASYLEYGTTRLLARPAWTPTVEDERDEFYRRMEAAAAKATK